MPFTLYIVLIAFGILATDGAKGKQRIKIKGRVMCGFDPYKNATVRLVNKNVFVNSIMAQRQTDSDGTFSLDGTGSDLVGDVDPALYIFHRCDKSGKWTCNREWSYTIPDEFIFNENDPKLVTIDFGTAQLKLKPNEESSKCLPFNKENTP